MPQYLLPLTNDQKQKTVELLSLIFNDDEFLKHASKVNGKVVDKTEEIMNDLIFCTRAITVLFSGLRCVPRTKNVYMWLMACLPALIELVKVNSKTIYTNGICHNAIMTHRESMKALLL